MEIDKQLLLDLKVNNLSLALEIQKAKQEPRVIFFFRGKVRQLREYLEGVRKC